MIVLRTSRAQMILCHELTRGAGQKGSENRHEAFADRREPELMLRVVRLDQVVGNLVRKREVPEEMSVFVQV